MIFSSSHDHGPALSFFKLPRSGASLSFTQAATITGLRYHFFFCFFFPFYTATITGQFYHFLKQPRSRVCVIIFFFFFFFIYIYTATITGQFCHFLKQPRSRACVIIFFFFFFYILPRSRARFPIFSCCLDHEPAL